MVEAFKFRVSTSERITEYLVGLPPILVPTKVPGYKSKTEKKTSKDIKNKDREVEQVEEFLQKSEIEPVSSASGSASDEASGGLSLED